MTRTFKNFDEYESYYENHEHRYNDVDIAENEFTVSADGEFECKSWKTALRRFFKALANDSRFDDWYEAILESIKNGIWKEVETIDGEYFLGGFHWSVEELDDNLWYIELTVGK